MEFTLNNFESLSLTQMEEIDGGVTTKQLAKAVIILVGAIVGLATTIF